MEFYLIDIVFIYIAFTSIVWGIGFSAWILVRMMEKSNQSETEGDAFYHNTKRPMRIQKFTLVDLIKSDSNENNN